MTRTVKDLFKKIDRIVFQGERVFVVVALVVMSIVVFLDVVHRTFASEDNKGVAALVKLLSYFGQTIEPGDPTYVSLEGWVPYALWVGFVALGVLGIRTASRREKIPMLKAVVLAVVGVVSVYGLIRVFVVMAPNGLVWSQRLALVLTLWVGFVAASMCTYENKHLKVEAAQRAIPEKFKPYVVFVSAVFTALVCFALMWLSTRFVLQRHVDFVETEGRGGLVPGLDLPLYQAFAVLPLSFAIMTVRFLARGVFALGGELPVAPSIEGLDQLDKYERGVAPSEVATEVGVVSKDAAQPQSHVKTDPHDAADAADEQEVER
jgi:TRAP-type C4-dicarboxylate transport system permease small subunit